MKYDLAIKFEADKAKEYFDKLLEKGNKIELKKISPKRSLSQNGYFYAIVGIIGDEIGYSAEEMIIVFKRKFGLFYEKGENKFLKSTKDLDSRQMSDFIEQIRNFAAQAGLYILSPEEYFKGGEEMERYLQRNRIYL